MSFSKSCEWKSLPRPYTKQEWEELRDQPASSGDSMQLSGSCTRQTHSITNVGMADRTLPRHAITPTLMARRSKRWVALRCLMRGLAKPKRDLREFEEVTVMLWMKISRNHTGSIELQAKTDGTNLPKSCSGTLKRLEKRFSAWRTLPATKKGCLFPSKRYKRGHRGSTEPAASGQMELRATAIQQPALTSAELRTFKHC